MLAGQGTEFNWMYVYIWYVSGTSACPSLSSDGDARAHGVWCQPATQEDNVNWFVKNRSSRSLQDQFLFLSTVGIQRLIGRSLNPQPPGYTAGHANGESTFTKGIQRPNSCQLLPHLPLKVERLPGYLRQHLPWAKATKYKVASLTEIYATGW